MAHISVKPLIIKAYIGGKHASLCDKCHQKTWCTAYASTKRVFYCKMPHSRIKRLSEEGRGGMKRQS